MSSCFCCVRKTTEEVYTEGLHLLHATTSQDTKTFIAALKILKKAADRDHVGACYQFGNAVWDADSLEVEKVFQDCVETSEYFAQGQHPVLLDYRRALAQKYLLRAFNNDYPGSLHRIQAIAAYAAEQVKLKEQSGLIDLTVVPYQKL